MILIQQQTSSASAAGCQIRSTRLSLTSQPARCGKLDDLARAYRPYCRANSTMPPSVTFRRYGLAGSCECGPRAVQGGALENGQPSWEMVDAGAATHDARSDRAASCRIRLSTGDCLLGACARRGGARSTPSACLPLEGCGRTSRGRAPI